MYFADLSKCHAGGVGVAGAPVVRLGAGRAGFGSQRRARR